MTTVAELAKYLAKLPQDAEVECVYGYQDPEMVGHGGAYWDTLTLESNFGAGDVVLHDYRNKKAPNWMPGLSGKYVVRIGDYKD